MYLKVLELLETHWLLFLQAFFSFLGHLELEGYAIAT